MARVRTSVVTFPVVIVAMETYLILTARDELEGAINIGTEKVVCAVV